MSKIIKLSKDNLQGLYFFVEGLNFPVVAASYNSWERQQLTFLETNLSSTCFNTEAVCQWCINHNIQYQILYPLRKIDILKNPYKYYRFIRLKKKLKYSL